jgi:hypothetical protein
MNHRRFLIFAILISFFLVNCSPAQSAGSSAEVQTLEKYIHALAGKDEAAYSSLICPDWESAAFLEFDAYQGVESQLGEITCTKTGGQGNSATVNCQGKISLSYGSEKQVVDLSPRNYKLISNGGNWLVCGFTTSAQ